MNSIYPNKCRVHPWKSKILKNSMISTLLSPKLKFKTPVFRADEVDLNIVDPWSSLQHLWLCHSFPQGVVPHLLTLSISIPSLIDTPRQHQQKYIPLLFKYKCIYGQNRNVKVKIQANKYTRIHRTSNIQGDTRNVSFTRKAIYCKVSDRL